MDVIVIEYYLGLLNGADVAYEIKRVSPQIPIGMVTDHLELAEGTSKVGGCSRGQIRRTALLVGDHPLCTADKVASSTRRSWRRTIRDADRKEHVYPFKKSNPRGR
jgi:hypothetical protein